MKSLKKNLNEITRYPSAVAGLVIVAFLLVVSAYALVTIPYREAIRLWRGGEDIWQDSPKNAQPLWFNVFTKKDLPKTIIISSQDRDAEKQEVNLAEGIDEITMNFDFDFPYSGFPQEIAIYFSPKYVEKPPHVTLTWNTPDGREIVIGEFSVQQYQTFRLSQDERLMKKLDGLPAEKGLFTNPDSGSSEPVQGHYSLAVSALVFEEAADFDAKLVMYGQVHGLAGTDHRRRDLTIALLWGTPIALAFGLVAAFGTTLLTMSISAIGVWFGKWVDNLIQRITEINLILPVLPILIMVGTFYNRSIWVMLGMVILLSIFGNAIKTYRAVFLQVKEAPYIEAAKAYGAGRWRIIFRYLIPRIIPMLVPQLVVLVPTFVFLEASLAVLGLGDPVLPTWGKLIDDARANGALYHGQYYWVLQPSALLMLTGLAFSMIGFALDRVFNPRLRGL